MVLGGDGVVHGGLVINLEISRLPELHTDCQWVTSKSGPVQEHKTGSLHKIQDKKHLAIHKISQLPDLTGVQLVLIHHQHLYVLIQANKMSSSIPW